MEAALTAAGVAVRGGSIVRPLTAYACTRGPPRVVGAGLAVAGRRRTLVAVSALPEPLEPVSSPAPEADDDEELDVHGGAAEFSSPSDAPGNTVRVRFVLKKQCPFGQSFHLVGDDPGLGLWDPEKSVALQWAEGHEWMVEKDLPANKLIDFKFLLRDTSGEFLWQNGPNRTLQTGETVSMLVVYEDWGDMKNQKVEEEGVASIGTEDAVVLLTEKYAADSDDNESRNDRVVENELQMDDNRSFEKNLDDNKEEQDASIASEEDEKSAFVTIDSDREDSMRANKQNSPKTFPREELKRPGQLYEGKEKESDYTSFADESYAEKTSEEKDLSENGVPVENELTNAYEHDFLWGWKALQQLLMRLGFKMNTS